MSFLAKTTTGFFGLGICSVTSLIIAHKYKEPIKTFAAPPAVVVSEPPSVTESIQRLIFEEKYKGCANLTSGSRGTFFYVCLKAITSDFDLRPFFFYHDKDKSSTNSFPKINQIKKDQTSSTSLSVAEVQMMFDTGSKNIKSYQLPTWLRNLAYSNSDLANVCKVESSSGGSSSSFTLKCNNRPVQKSIQI